VQRFLPSIRIHAWGGLGSQLFAVALAQDICEKFPHRRIRIVLHSGGVTHRIPEVTSLYPQWDYLFVDDFVNSGDLIDDRSPSKTIVSKARYLRLIKSFLYRSGIASSCDNNQEFSNIKPWLLICRGHYSYRSIGAKFLSELDKTLTRILPPLDARDMCSIHYRMGDLLTLKEKNPISGDLILNQFKSASKIYNFKRLIVFSDSPNDATKIFETVKDIELLVPDTSTVEAIAYSADAKLFIGTSSKISFWISGIRSQIRKKPSLLPEENLVQFRELVGNGMNQITTYSISE
jgi:hypothetical protein